MRFVLFTLLILAAAMPSGQLRADHYHEQEISRLKTRLSTLIAQSKRPEFSASSSERAKELAYLLSHRGKGLGDFDHLVLEECSKSSKLTSLYIFVLEQKKYFAEVGRYVSNKEQSFAKNLKSMASMNSLYASLVLRRVMLGFTSPLQSRFFGELYQAGLLSGDQGVFIEVFKDVFSSHPHKALSFTEALRSQGAMWADFDAAYDYVAQEPEKFGAAHSLRALSILGGACDGLRYAQDFE
jgi:hypothetical protein